MRSVINPSGQMNYRSVQEANTTVSRMLATKYTSTCVSEANRQPIEVHLRIKQSKDDPLGAPDLIQKWFVSRGESNANITALAQTVAMAMQPGMLCCLASNTLVVHHCCWWA